MVYACTSIIIIIIVIIIIIDMLKTRVIIQVLYFCVVGKVFCKILNDRLVQYLDKNGKIHEGQAGFRAGRCCIDNIFTLNELIQGRLKEGKNTFAFFLDIQKAYESVWCNGLWLKLWNMGLKGTMWRVIKIMYNSSRSAILLEGEKSSTFSVEQGVLKVVAYHRYCFQSSSLIY